MLVEPKSIKVPYFVNQLHKRIGQDSNLLPMIIRWTPVYTAKCSSDSLPRQTNTFLLQKK